MFTLCALGRADFVFALSWISLVSLFRAAFATNLLFVGANAMLLDYCSLL